MRSAECGMRNAELAEKLKGQVKRGTGSAEREVLIDDSEKLIVDSLPISVQRTDVWLNPMADCIFVHVATVCRLCCG